MKVRNQLTKEFKKFKKPYTTQNARNSTKQRSIHLISSGHSNISVKSPWTRHSLHETKKWIQAKDQRKRKSNEKVIPSRRSEFLKMLWCLAKKREQTIYQKEKKTPMNLAREKAQNREGEKGKAISRTWEVSEKNSFPKSRRGALVLHGKKERERVYTIYNEMWRYFESMAHTLLFPSILNIVTWEVMDG